MRKQQHILTHFLAAAALAASTSVVVADGDGPYSDDNYCMDVVVEPFHMVPDETCAVKDYWGGWLQEKYYPFTMEDHLFNCDYFEQLGGVTPLPNGDFVPSSVVSDGAITGTIDGNVFSGTLLCASLTNWYQDSCADPTDPMTCSFQLAQPFLKSDTVAPYHARVTEVSVLDGVITVDKGDGKTADVPVVMATRAAGIMHIEDLNPEAPQVGASITHSLLGMVAYEMDDEGVENDEMDGEGGEDDSMKDVKDLGGSLDLLLQGHIFYPADQVDETPAVIKGSICSKKLYRLLNREGKRPGKQDDDDGDDPGRERDRDRERDSDDGDDDGDD